MTTGYARYRGRLLATLAAIVLIVAGGCVRKAPTSATGPFTTQPAAAAQSAQPLTLTICSFNIQFLGSSRLRENKALADLLMPYDIVVVQELVAPPYPGSFPNGQPFTPDPEAAAFFNQMTANGFSYVLSEEETGTGEVIHRNETSTEWWVAFYRRDRVHVAADLPSGFLSDDRSDNLDYERVPYAFAFRAADGSMDFVVVSVHLKPGDSGNDAKRRQHELSAIAGWVHTHDQQEKDFLIVGDMNIQHAAELAASTPAGFVSLNDECRPTNINPNDPRPYDHVMYQPAFTTEIDTEFDFRVVDLIDVMRCSWTASDPYPGGPPYDHNRFRARYSDHHPVLFRMAAMGPDDD